MHFLQMNIFSELTGLGVGALMSENWIGEQLWAFSQHCDRRKDEAKE